MNNNFLPYFFEALNSQSIQYCVWGNYEGLPTSLNGSDLDILVKESNKINFKSILNDSLKIFNGKIVSYFYTQHSEHYRIAGIYEGKSWGIMIDVIYEEFYYKGKVYIPADWIWDFTTKHNDITVNDLGFSYLAGFLKELLHNGVVKDKYFLNSIAEIKKKPQKYKLFFISVYGESFFKLLVSEFKKQKIYISLSILRQKGKKNIGASKFFIFTNNFRKLKRLLCSSPGFTIAFLGTDGSGKSTIIEKIKPPLNDAFHNAVYYEHMRPNRYPSIARLMGKKEEFSGPVTNPHGSEPSGFLGSLVRWSYYMLDYTFGFYLKVWPKKAIRSCVWIFDRYYYDYLIDPKRGRINLPQWILKLGQFIIPEPDIIICLGADAQTIHNRKPELTLKEVERQVAELKRFCNSHKRVVWIDTGNSIEKSSTDALEAIIKVMAKRFEWVKLTE